LLPKELWFKYNRKETDTRISRKLGEEIRCFAPTKLRKTTASNLQRKEENFNT
jgi:hypothetical protein